MVFDQIKKGFLIVLSALLLAPCLPVKASAAPRTMTSVATPYEDADELKLRQKTEDGYILAGKKEDNIVLIKTDVNGKVQWSSTFDEGAIESPKSLRQTSDGGYILSGDTFTETFESRGFYALKVNSNGTLKWSHIYSGYSNAVSTDIWQLQDNSYILAGYYRPQGQDSNNDQDVILLKLDDSGMYQKMLGSFKRAGDQAIYAALPLLDGTSILVGSTRDQSNTVTKGLIIKVDSEGNEKWHENVGTISNNIVLTSINTTPDGGYILVGNDNGSLQQLLLMKIDNDGKVQWEKSYKEDYLSMGATVIPTRDGGYLAGGSINAMQSPMYLLKTNAYGDKQWDQVFAKQTRAHSILQLSDGSYSVVGGSPAAVLHIGVAAPTGLTADDQSNRISGWDESMEYSMDGGVNYSPYSSDSEPVFSGNKEVVVRYKEDTAGGYEAGANTVFNFTAGDNATLKEIRVDGVPLSGFDPNRSDYSVNVPESADHVTVIGAVYDAGTTLTVNGFPTQPEKAEPITLSRQSTEIIIIATAENGNTKTYNITVNRVRDLSGNADLSGIAVNDSPITDFSKDITNYTVEATPGSQSVTVTADVYDAGAKLHINGIAAGSGEDTEVPLIGSETVISIGVTAENGIVQKGYTVTVTRPELLSANADLGGITVNGSPIAGFSNDVTRYTVEAVAGTEKVSIAADAADTEARLRINGTLIASGQTVDVTLSGSSTAISIEVTAENGTAQKVYTVTVSRPELPAGQAKLDRLLISQGTLTPAFTADQTEYAASVAYYVGYVAITAEAADPEMVLTVNGQPADSGEAVTIPLYTGVNKVSVKVTAQNGTEKIYTIDVTREPLQTGGGSGSSHRDKEDKNTAQSDDSRLSSVKLSAGVLKPAFTPNVQDYIVTADKTQTSLRIYAKAFGNGKILVNGDTLQADGWSLPIVLNETGDTKITISAQAANGEANIYTITVQRLAETPAEKPLFEGTNEGTGETSSPSVVFTDTVGHWAEPLISKAVQADIIQGYPNGSFYPNDQVTRAQFITMLSRALHLKSSSESFTFYDSDIIPDWSAGAVAAAHEAGIIEGYPDGSFRPLAPITRTEMTILIVKTLQMPVNTSTTNFTDDDQIPQWAKPYASTAAEQGIINGRSSGMFTPNEHATRAEATVIIMRLLNQ